jgi:hypothetical protein
MPVRELFTDHIEQECIACDHVHEVAFTTLRVGVERVPRFSSSNLIQLPPCPVCGAVEFLAKSLDDEPSHPSPGSYGHRHKLLVNKLYGQLVRAGGLHSDLEPTMLLSQEPTDETMQQWFPNGLRLYRLKEGATARRMTREP